MRPSVTVLSIAKKILDHVARWLDGVAAKTAELLLGQGGHSALIAWAWGVSITFVVRKAEWWPKITVRESAFLTLVAGSAFLLCLFAAIRLVQRRLRGCDLHSTWMRANTWLTPIVGVPFLLVVGKGTEARSPFLTLTFLGVAVGTCLYPAWRWRDLSTTRFDNTNASARASSEGSSSELPSPKGPLNSSTAELGGRKRRIWVMVGLILLFLLYTGIMSKLSIDNLLSFNMRRADMGFYSNIFRQSSMGVPLGLSLSSRGNHLGGHFDPILVLLSPIYLLYPHSETILVLQSAWLGSSVFPLFLLGRHYGLPRSSAFGLCVCLCLAPALHGINLFDFHSLALCVPVILWMLYFFERARGWPFFVTYLLLLSVREDMALVSIMFGGYALASGKAHGRRWGWLVLVSAVAYLFVVKSYIMVRSDLLNIPSKPSTGGVKRTGGYAASYAQLLGKGGTTLDLVSNLIYRPVYALTIALEPNKLRYVVLQLLPVLGLPLLARRRRLLLVYGFAFTLLSSVPHLPSVHFHYSALLVPFVFPLAAWSLAMIQQGKLLQWLASKRKGAHRVLVLGCLLTSLLVSWKFGGWLPNKTFRGGFRPLKTPSSKDLELAAWLKTICRTKIPMDAVLVTSSAVLPQLGNCMNLKMRYPRKGVDYVLTVRKSGKKLRKVVQRDVRKGKLKLLHKAHGARLYQVVKRRGQKQERTKASKG